MANEKHIEIIRTVAYIAWKAAANAFRLYPDGKHTFSEYWATAKIQFNEELQLLQSEHDKEQTGLLQKIEDQSYTAAKVIDALEEANATIRQLRGEIEELKNYYQHTLDCWNRMSIDGDICSCGLDEFHH